MATVNEEIFQKFNKAQKLLKIRPDADGREVKVDVREDEDQSEKLKEIIDLLVAAGYFRARIKGLSSFDKVVGGMTWCIESCNVDVNVDFLFQENSTIGQKIALSEKIVAVLPKLKCPHHIEPHQIQGLDFKSIFLVVQWLVKRSMEYRQEMSASVRAYAVNQFTREFNVKDKEFEKQKRLHQNINAVKEIYRPHRYFKRKTAPPPDLESRVQITLLEYGHRGREPTIKSDKANASLTEDELEQQQFHKQMQELLNNLTLNKDEEPAEYNELNEGEKQHLQKHYATLQLELQDGGSKSKQFEEISSLEEQKLVLIEKCKQLEKHKLGLSEKIEHEQSELAEIRLKRSQVDRKMKELEDIQVNQDSLTEIEDLVKLSDSLKAEKIRFKEQCRKDLAKLQQDIHDAKETKTPVALNPNHENEVKQLTENIANLRLKLAKKNRIVANLQRQLDDIPNRAELAQYQRRFMELYNQVAAKYKETKQYYTLFNTLEDTRFYMQKELSLLNSISDNYPEAIQSPASREEFLKQLQNIVEGVRESKLEKEKKLMEGKRKKDDFAQTLQALVEMQRKYVAAIRQLKEDCRKHEEMLMKIEHRS